MNAIIAVVFLASAVNTPIAKGPFKADMDSLKQYQCPDWFRDAKFGMWAHWGPQAVPEMGDWYAQRMYKQGDVKYKDHLERWGHPSEHGYKDIIPLWKAEKWDPGRLIQLYKKAGAKYFVSMGSHHDNFYLWNSKLHKWNSVNMGPHRDVVGDWQKAAKKHGLYFGVSEHLGASFTWFQWSHKADKDGPKAGVPYDGANPKWHDLYHFPAEEGDDKWYSTNSKWHQQWYDRIRELVDNYKPDLLYTDGKVPFENEVGLAMIAHLYNSIPQVVYNCKQKQAEGRWVEDIERGVMPGIHPYPWQTDTSIGDWYYNRNWEFRPVTWTIHMLVDIVSKNGNLLLNIVQRPDGSLDPEVEQQLEELAKWIAIHGEAIYGTRPWLVHGEGAVRTKGGHFKEDFKYTAKDIRFTTKSGLLYATALGWPSDGKLLVRSLAEPAGKVTGVTLLGSKAKLSWKQTADGLLVNLPAQKISEFTATLKITGKNLKPAPVPLEPVIVQADAKGVFKLDANDAELHGDKIKIEMRGIHANIGFWDKPSEWASWKVQFDKPGTYRINLDVATVHAGIEAVVEIAGQTFTARIPQTGDWDKSQGCFAGKIEIKQAGVQTLTVRSADGTKWKAINLRAVRLTRVE
ncbi:MAG: alpha-L-fucosidase [Verrucomicrobia bacterium]|nr:alpha-L-fucosidase [Verrucomicrobiota bacterium]